MARIKCRCGKCDHVFDIVIPAGDTDKLDYLLTCSCDKCGAVEPLTFSAPDNVPPRFDHEFERGPYGVCKRCGEGCAELYQVIGTMRDHCPDPNDIQIIKALDNASAAANGLPRKHYDLLPFVLPEPKS